MSKKTEETKDEMQSALPYRIVDLVLEHARMERMPKQEAQTPEFRLVIANAQGCCIKAVRKMIEEAWE